MSGKQQRSYLPTLNLVEVFDGMSFGSRDLIYRPYQENI